MIKSFFTILFSILFFNCFSQTIKQDTVVIKKGTNTELIITNSSDKSKQIIRKKDDKLHGLQEKYGPNGLISQKMEYKEGFLNGLNLTYNYDGTLNSERPYVFSKTKNKSVLEGKVKNYQNKNLYSITSYKDDLKNGPTIVYYSNGKIAEKSNYNQDLLIGKQEVYYDNGQLRWIVFYEIIDDNSKPKSVKNGNQLYYNKDGKLLTDTNFKFDKKNGIFKEYNQKTFLLESEVNYKDDKVHGKMNKYYSNGSIKIKANYYVEIEVNGIKFSNIYDGQREEYHENGRLNFSQNYVLGKRNGILEKYNPEGFLIEKAFYKDDLLVDRHETFDNNGNKTTEVNYAIIKEGDVLKSVKIGNELKWKNNILIYKSFYNNGLEEGLCETFYDSGAISMSVQKLKGVQNGFKTEYYENGIIKSKTNFVQIIPKDWTPFYQQVGWAYIYDENGKLTHQRFQSVYEKEIYALFNNNKSIKYQINKTLSFAYFPNGELMSLTIMNDDNQTIFATHYYQNKEIRKIIYQEPSFLNDYNLVFSDDGKLQNSYLNYGVYTDNNRQPFYLDSNDKIVKGENPKPLLDKTYIASINKDWYQSRLFSDTNKNGKYVLNYANSKPFLEMEFEDNLPNGKMLVYEPTKSDTLVFKNFSKGIQTGDFVEKFAGKKTLRRGKYHENGKIAESFRIAKNGKPYEKSFFDNDGKTIKTISFHDNGNVEQIQNYNEKTFSRYDLNSKIVEEKYKLENKLDWSVYKKYHKNSSVLASETFYYKEEADSIHRQFFEDGSLQLQFQYKKNKRNGTFVEYFQNGEIKTKGSYVNDDMNGKWIRSDGKSTKISYYKNGRLEVVPTLKKCECNDTLMPANKLRYAPLLKNLVEFNNLKRSIPSYIIPVDSLNYDATFYINLQTSSGNNSGFASMKLLLFKPFAFYIPANKQVKITLNPCITEGYISSFDVLSTYFYDNNSRNRATLLPKRVALELIDSPLQSNEIGFDNFTSYFDVNPIEIQTSEKLSIIPEDNENGCHTLGKIKDFLFVEVEKAAPLLFEESNRVDLFFYNLTKEERDNFFGLAIQNAKIRFTLLESENEISVEASTNQLYASGNYVVGKMAISCKKTAEDEYILNDNKSTISAQNIKKELMKNGFLRIKTMFNSETNQLEIDFFAEK
jgi:antitoxin component YwqK of YwqJK toxin-antitoxin module